MSKKHIDHLFKEGLDGKGLPYDATHWAAMESILDAEQAPAAGRLNWEHAAWALLILASALYIILPLPGNSPETVQTAPSGPHMAQEGSMSSSVQEAADPGGTIPQEVTQPMIAEAPSPAVSLAHPAAPMASNQFNPQQFVPDPRNATDDPVMASPVNEPLEEALDLPLYQALFNEHFVPLFAMDRIVFPYSYPTAKSNVFEAPPLRPGRWNQMMGVSAGTVVHSVVEQPASDQRWSRSAQPGFHLNLDYHLSKGHWSIASGLGIQLLNQRSDLTGSVQTMHFDTSLHLTIREYQQRGDGSYIALLERRVDTTVSSYDTVLCQGCAARSTYISIPLEMGYTRHFGAWSSRAILGMRYTYLAGAQGEDVDEQLGSMVSMDRDHLRTHGAQAYVGLSLQYAILPDARIRLQYTRGQSLGPLKVTETRKTSFDRVGLGIEWNMFE